ncbi:MAG TPA: hypothetical protein VHT24_02995 [Pseudacidobacterium sp.]|jgi:hypothetical protein|nr:hypothetical protein [Pseudacidobacterium sp.]
MPNLNIPEVERSLTPAEIEALDKRRQWGLTFQVIAGQFAIFAVLLTLWSGQDATYSPGWVRPMVFYNILAVVLAVGFGAWGSYLKRGRTEFASS